MQLIFVCCFCILKLYWDHLLILTNECWKRLFSHLADITLLCLSQYNFDFYVCILSRQYISPQKGECFCSLSLGLSTSPQMIIIVEWRFQKLKIPYFCPYKLCCEKDCFYNLTSNSLTLWIYDWYHWAIIFRDKQWFHTEVNNADHIQFGSLHFTN